MPCNNDLLAANFIDDGEQVRIIDYEYAGNNDACFELGNIWSECHLTLDELEELITAYYGKPLRNKVARAQLQGLMSRYGWTLWASIQHHSSPLDFDFWSWGMEKYDAAVRRASPAPRSTDCSTKCNSRLTPAALPSEDHSELLPPRTDRRPRTRPTSPRSTRTATPRGLNRSLGELLLVRRRLQLHLDPHRHVPAVRLRLRLRRPADVLVLDHRPGRPVLRRPDVRRAQRPLPDRRLGLPVVQEGRQPGRVLDGRLDHAVGSIVTVAAVAIAWNIALPPIWSGFQVFDVTRRRTPSFLGTILIIITTIINVLGVKIMSKINNVGVAAELVGVAIIIVLLLVHARRGPQVVFDTQGVTAATAGHGALGILAPILLAAVMPAYVMFGFDTAGSLAEETTRPAQDHAQGAAAGAGGGRDLRAAAAALRAHGRQEHQALDTRCRRPAVGAGRRPRQHAARRSS